MCFILNNLRNACYFSREDLVKEWARYVVKDWARYVADIQNFLCFVDRASRHNCAKKDQLDAQLILSIFRQHLHVSGVSRPINRRYNRMYTTTGTYYSFRRLSVALVGLFQLEQSNQHNRQSSKENNKYHLLYTYGCTS